MTLFRVERCLKWDFFRHASGMMSRGSRVIVGRVKCLESKAAALDLVAADTGVELLEVGLVLAGDEGVGDPAERKPM
jgi:hypothetical protein